MTIPLHKWTHTGNKIRLLKCVKSDGTSYQGFQWPSSGIVQSPNWSPEPTCESGGLFGWPWGIGIGDGKTPDYKGVWIVFEADPDDIVQIGNKCKVPRAEVVFYGNWYDALMSILPGQIAWIRHNSTSTTGNGETSSATGDYGASSATGDYGASSATGYYGASSATGDCGASSATGHRGASSATGYHGASSATGKYGASSATGHRGASSATGYRGASSATGDYGASSATGYYGASSATGHRGTSSATGKYGASSATGDGGIAVATGEHCAVEAKCGIAATTANIAIWIVHENAVFIQRYQQNNIWKTFVLHAEDYELRNGDCVTIRNGQVVDIEPSST